MKRATESFLRLFFLNSSENSFLVWTSIFLGITYSLNIAALCSYMKTNKRTEKSEIELQVFPFWGLLKSKHMVLKIKSKFGFLEIYHSEQPKAKLISKDKETSIFNCAF